MRIAIIGPGAMGEGIGRLLARAGHEVVFSGSRSPQKLARASEAAGANARSANLPGALADSGAWIELARSTTDRLGAAPSTPVDAGPSTRHEMIDHGQR
jgi:3-hydroxyacyl-CoA dehydrogenase